MSEEEDELEEKVGPTVRYLQKLGSTHLILIFESSKWIFDLDPQAALEVCHSLYYREGETNQ